MENFGLNVKSQREKMGLTLRDVAKKVNLSPSYLSQIENNKTFPSLSAAKNIADVLNTTVGFLIGEETSIPVTPIIIKKHKRKSLINFGYGLELQFLSTFDHNNKMEPTIQILQENTISGNPPYQHEGDEFCFVLEGTIKIVMGDNEYDLEEGDSIYFKSNIPHSIKNVSKKQATALFVTSPTYF
jgi:transcriptional regulator with XRE-family HTH domain